MSPAKPPAIDDHGLRRFRDIIARRLGIACDDARHDQLNHILAERLRATDCAKAGDYLDHLDSVRPAQSELRTLAERLTVTETYFFRHLDQIQAFTEVALTERACDPAGPRRLQILSAGCSSGEEPYSLAMAAQTHTPGDAGWDVAITGVDISDRQIALARRGVYSEWALRAIPDAMRTRHFRPEGRHVRLDDRIRAAVTFENRNLMDADPDFWAVGRFDVIFCRNVLMYFTAPAMQQVVARLARSLAPGGFLFLGSAETLRGISHEFHLCHTHDAFYYRHRPTAPNLAVTGSTGEAAAFAPPHPATVSPSYPASPGGTPDTPALSVDPSWPKEIARASDRIAILLGRSAMPEPAGPGGPGDESPAAPLQPPVAGPAQSLPAIRILLHRERYRDAMQALSLLPGADGDPDAQLLLAVALTQQGAIVPAEQVCRHLLSLDDLNAGAHYLMALCADHGGDRTAAWKHDQTAAHLDPGFAMPHVHMGRLARADGRRDAAQRAFRHAHDLLEREETSRILLFGGGFNREALLRLCRAELATAEGRQHDR